MAEMGRNGDDAASSAPASGRRSATVDSPRMDHATAAQIAGVFGLFAGLLSIAIPFGLWWVALRRWKPKTCMGYAARCSLWPFVAFSFTLGGPVAREIWGIKSRYSSDLVEGIAGFGGLCMVTMPIVFVVCFLRSGSRFPEKTPEDSPTPREESPGTLVHKP